MKQLKRKPNIFTASNVTFDKDLTEARSYQWWVFVKKIQGKTVFNSYRYSPTTGKHQHKVRSLMRTLGIKIDVEVQVKEGLNDHRNIKALIKESDRQVKERELARKQRIKAQRIYKKMLELGLYNKDGTPINANFEAKQITGQWAY